MPHKIPHGEAEKLQAEISERQRIYQGAMQTPYGSQLVEQASYMREAAELLRVQGSPSLAHKLRDMADILDPPQKPESVNEARRVALLQAAKWFEQYEQEHEANTARIYDDVEKMAGSRVKAKINETRANYCRYYADFK